MSPLNTRMLILQFSKRYNLSACVIEKSMSTLMAAIMCLLYDPGAYHSANVTLHMDIYQNR